MRIHVALLAAGLCATALAADSIPQGQLPDTATPTAYRLDLTILPDQPQFAGHAEIDIVLNAPARFLYLHGRDLKVTAATVLSGNQRLPVTFRQLDDLGTARVDFPQSLPAGPATLSFDYDAQLGEGAPSGLYRLKVADEWYVWSQFESIDARAAFPSFDQPGFKTPFTVTLTTKPGLLALSNMPESGAPLATGELVKHRFLPTPPLPTYLVAFVVGPFITAEGMAPPTALRNHPLPLRIVATRNEAGKLDYALRETPRIVELLENYFGQPFPFPKLDQIASPVMPGAMENAGADIYEDDVLLLDAGATTHQKQLFGMVVAHELSHQWFGDYVTPAWWDDIWLNESFANWMGYRIGNAWRPELNIGVGAISEALTAMGTDSLLAGRPIRQPILNSGEADSAFDGITYGKGGQIIAMIANYLGDDKFREGVRLHVRRRPYGNATSEDFFSALAEVAGDPRVLAAMRGFVELQGVPVVDIVPQGTGYRLTQSRYLRLGATAPAQSWIIPFCMRRGSESSCTLLDHKTQDVPVKGTGALIPNAGGTGYYRYFLPASDWAALIAQATQLPAGEALAANDSLWAQFSAGRIAAAALLEAAQRFADSPDSRVALYGGQKLAAWRQRGVITAAALGDYRRLMSAIYGRKLAALGFDPRVGAHAADPPDRQKLRQDMLVLVAGEAHDTAIRKQLDAAAVRYLHGDSNALDPGFLRLALRVHVEDGNLATTRALYERMLQTHDGVFRDAALGELGTGNRRADAQWLIGQLQDARLRPSDRIAIMGALMAETGTRDLAFEWMRTHYEQFAKGVGLFGVVQIPRLPAGYCSADKAREIEQVLLPKVVASGRAELPFRRMLESIATCGELKTAKGAEIAAALKQTAATL